MQLKLFAEKDKAKSIEHIDIEAISISGYNPRVTRPDEYVQRLADRIEQNGFEITRALWVYPNEEGYSVFAGGTRLRASKKADLKSIPCVVHRGFSEDEIVGLAEQDNENDEYHEEVPLVDKWMSYKALADQGWTQERIAKAKGVSRGFVSYRVRLACLPDAVLEIVKNGFMNEFQAINLLELSRLDNSEAAMLHVIEQAGPSSTAKDFKVLVAKTTRALSLLNEALVGLRPNLQEKLRQETVGVFDEYTMQRKIDKIIRVIAKEKREEEEAARAKLEKAERERLEAEKAEREARHRLLIDSIVPGQWWQLGEHWLYCGDTSAPEFKDRIGDCSLAFADPPYNASAADWDNDFNWRHDWLVEKSSIVAVTPGISSIFDFAKITEMPYRWSTACWISNGMTRGALGYGNWIYTGIFSTQDSINKNVQDFKKIAISNTANERTDHKGRKPDEYMDWILDTFTSPGDLVIDAFLGSGTTLLRCEEKDRRCAGGEINPEFCKEIVRQWENMTGLEAEQYVHTVQQEE